MDSGAQTQRLQANLRNCQTHGRGDSGGMNFGTGYLFWSSETQYDSGKLFEELSHSFMDCDPNCNICVNFIFALTQHIRTVHGQPHTGTETGGQSESQNSETGAGLTSKTTTITLEVNEQSNIREEEMQVVDEQEEWTPNPPTPTNETLIEPRVPDIPVPQTCRFCKNEFSSLSVLKLHLESAHPVKLASIKHYNCNICGLETSLMDLKQRKQHLRYAHPGEKAYHCSACSKAFRTEKSLTTHLKKCHDGDKRTFCCMKCDKLFFSRKKFTEHMVGSHSEEVKACEICGKTFGNQNNLTKHKVKCSQAKKLECEKKIVQNLSTAMDETSNESLFQLEPQSHPQTRTHLRSENDLPTSVFPSLRVLKAAEQSEHQEELEVGNIKPYECRLCGEGTTFASVDEVSQHHRESHRGQKFRLVCSLCHKYFCISKKFNIHYEKCVKMRLSCGICERRFASRFTLNQHLIASHPTESTKLVPTFCGRSFVLERKLAFHKREYHRGSSPETNDQETEIFIKTEVDPHEKRKRFECGTCEKRFFKSENLFRHLEKKHKNVGQQASNTQSHSCTICQLEFSSSKKLLSHCRKVHP